MNYVNFEVKGHKKTFKEKFIDVSNDIKIWWSENHEWAIIVLPVVLGGGTWVVKKLVNGTIDIAKLLLEDRRISRKVYDHSNGDYLTLKHKLTNKEAIELNRLRKEMGLTVTEALDKMHLI